jgi:hypothetical protein
MTRHVCSIIIVVLGLSAAACRTRTDAGVIAPGVAVETVAGGFEFTEGPTCDAAGNLYFTDQPNDRILTWSAAGHWVRPDGGLYFTDPFYQRTWWRMTRCLRTASTCTSCLPTVDLPFV